MSWVQYVHLEEKNVIFISSDENIALDPNTNVLYQKIGSRVVYKRLFQQLISYQAVVLQIFSLVFFTTAVVAAITAYYKSLLEYCYHILIQVNNTDLVTNY